MKCPECHFDNPSDSKFCKECGTQFIPLKEIPVTKTLEKPIQELIGGMTFAGRYQIIEELGRGGMGVVYKAQDTKLKRTVALKFLPPELTHVSEVKERFMREAQAAAALDHPNICTVHEFDEAEEKTFISMAYIEGQSLKKKIESGPLEIDEALRIATQVAEGLQEAHNNGVVHRDIKSANIMVTQKGQVKIMDFGLARIVGEALVTKEGMTMGTIAYMSPEQARGEEVDHRTDIWSLGVVLYEMFSGQLPFKGEHEQAVVYSILNQKPKSITDLKAEIPMSIDQVLCKALEKNPDERYQQIDDLLDDLKSISEGIVPEGVKARLRKAKLLRKKRVILYAGIAGFVIIMAVIALALFTGRVAAIDSIAVLPLRNISGESEQEIFAEGMTDALIAELGQVSAIRVISWQSVVRYKGSDKPLPEIAQELNVDALVEGSVLRSEDRVRVTALLVRADPEENLWAKSYEHEIKDILLLQSEVAQAIVREIKAKLTPEEKTRLARSRSVNPEAHEAYIKGMFHWNKRTDEDLKESAKYFERAIELDPTYAIAYVGLADAYSILGTRNIVPRKVADAKGKEAVKKALELDEFLGGAHQALGGLKTTEYDWESAEKEYKRAIELSPGNAWAYNAYAQNLALGGRFDEAIRMIKKAQELDPLSPINSAIEGYIYFFAREYDKGIEQCKKTLEMDSDFELAKDWLIWNYVEKGQYEDAMARESPNFMKGLSYAKTGKITKAKQEIAGFIERSKTPQRAHSNAAIAFLYFALGENDNGFEWLDKAYKEKNYYLLTLKVNPWFDPVRSDPRFKAILKKMNLE